MNNLSNENDSSWGWLLVIVALTIVVYAIMAAYSIPSAPHML